MTKAPEDMERAFLESIVAQPEDVYQWLILADWLEDCDDPRAELVRLSWSLQHERSHPEFDLRQARLQELIAGGMMPVVPRCTLNGFEFAWIPPGRFRIGSPTDEISRDDDEAQHEVRISCGFWMGVHPITQAQWQAVTGENPGEYSPSGELAADLELDRPEDLARFPVENISRDQLPDFLPRLGQLLGRAVALPTEAQWEYACRAGTTTPFPWGDTLDGTQANCDGTNPYGTQGAGRYLRRPSVVGSYPPNPWGLYDLIGNVGEWTRDTYRFDYENLPMTDPVWEEMDPRRVVFRGGSWDRQPIYCRVAYRNHIGPQATMSNIGVRVILV